MTSLVLSIVLIAPFLYAGLGIIHAKLFFLRYPSLYKLQYENSLGRIRIKTNKQVIFLVSVFWPVFLMWWVLYLFEEIINLFLFKPLGLAWNATGRVRDTSNSMLRSGGGVVRDFVKPREKESVE